MNDLDFQKGLREIFNSKTGSAVLKALEETYVDIRALDSTPELTYYRLGQKELIQALVKTASSTDEITPVTIIQSEE